MGNSPAGISDKFLIDYRLRVEPPGEAPFEADVTVLSHDLLGAPDPQQGMTMAVLYDLDDHRRVALGLAATKQTVLEQSKALWDREDREDREENDSGMPPSGDPPKRSRGSRSCATKGF